jgi:hypothetical protein
MPNPTESAPKPNSEPETPVCPTCKGPMTFTFGTIELSYTKIKCKVDSCRDRHYCGYVKYHSVFNEEALEKELKKEKVPDENVRTT